MYIFIPYSRWSKGFYYKQAEAKGAFPTCGNAPKKVLSGEVSVLNGKAVGNQESLHRLFGIVEVKSGGLHDVSTGITGIKGHLDDGGSDTGDVVIRIHVARAGGRTTISVFVITVIRIGIITGGRSSTQENGKERLELDFFGNLGFINMESKVATLPPLRALGGRLNAHRTPGAGGRSATKAESGRAIGTAANTIANTDKHRTQSIAGSLQTNRTTGQRTNTLARPILTATTTSSKSKATGNQRTYGKERFIHIDGKYKDEYLVIGSLPHAIAKTRKKCDAHAFFSNFKDGV